MSFGGGVVRATRPAEPDAVSLLRVRVREGDPLPGGAPAGDPDLDLRAAAGEQELLDQLRPRDRRRQVDLGGQEGVRVVELRQERLEECGRLDLFGLLEEELAPVLEDAAPD